ncbi:hypothetical protein l11_05790 [Neisseria weaveri LMG 5135]|nr:hypothetical protein l11_05790 [Neisseria weaveri LMG 5135]
MTESLQGRLKKTVMKCRSLRCRLKGKPFPDFLRLTKLFRIIRK